MKIKSLFGIVALTTLFASCKDDKPSNTNNDGLSALSALYDDLRANEQVFTVPAGTDYTITGQNGTKITFYGHSFKDKNNNIVTSGNVTILLKEVLEYNQMVANRVQTVTESDQLLTSGGAIHIVALLGADTLEANGYGIMFNQRINTVSPVMALYPGYETNVIGGTGVNWWDDTSGTTFVKRFAEPDSFEGFYNFDSCFDFGWVNCDYYAQINDPKTNIGVVMTDNKFNSTNTEVIIVDKGLNMVANLSGYNANSQTFLAHSPSYFLPLGRNISMIVIGVSNGTIYADTMRNVTITQNLTLTPTLRTATNAEVGAMINEL